ncbi:MAG: RNA polymerase sigma-70 factor [Bacteroidota bacterium]
MIEYKNLEDEQLVKSLKKGNLHSYDTLFRKYSKKLLYFALGYINTKEDAEGLVQEVFMIIWRNHKQLEEQQSFSSYLFTITYNAIRKHYRKKGREKKLLDLFLSDYDESDLKTVSQLEYKELTDRLEEIIETFSERRKEVFKLSRQEHYTNQEIAEKLYISKKTVENHITDSLKILREKLNISLFFLVCMNFF